jgi:hypothetical protein
MMLHNKIFDPPRPINWNMRRGLGTCLRVSGSLYLDVRVNELLVSLFSLTAKKDRRRTYLRNFMRILYTRAEHLAQF